MNYEEIYATFVRPFVNELAFTPGWSFPRN